MPHFTASSTVTQRPGAVLMVVIMMLTLFAVVGLTFVFYANDAATASRIYREASAPVRLDMEPEVLFGFFMNQFVYDVHDDAAGSASALRGHSLARNLFGFDYTLSSNGALMPAANDVPFNGTGRLHLPLNVPGVLVNVDDHRLINYRYFVADGFVRDPERPGWRADLRRMPQPFRGGLNPSYTYPDLNHV